jgi:hypothetical protein
MLRGGEQSALFFFVPLMCFLVQVSEYSAPLNEKLNENVGKLNENVKSIYDKVSTSTKAAVSAEKVEGAEVSMWQAFEIVDV